LKPRATRKSDLKGSITKGRGRRPGELSWGGDKKDAGRRKKKKAFGQRVNTLTADRENKFVCNAKKGSSCHTGRGERTGSIGTTNRVGGFGAKWGTEFYVLGKGRSQAREKKKKKKSPRPPQKKRYRKGGKRCAARAL